MTEQMNFTLDIFVSPEFESMVMGTVDYMQQTGEEWKAWVGEQPRRSGQLAETANFQINGQEMELLAMHYLHFAFYGTGVYGPYGAPFGPISAQALRWESWPDGEEVVRMWSSGYIWEGALEDAQSTIEEALRQYIAEHPIRPENAGFWQSLIGLFRGR